MDSARWVVFQQRAHHHLRVTVLHLDMQAEVACAQLDLTDHRALERVQKLEAWKQLKFG